MPETILYITGKPGNAGSPVPPFSNTWKPVYAAGLMVCTWEATQSGRPRDKSTLRYPEARLCGRPVCIHLGSPTMWEARYQDLRSHGRQSRPEAVPCVYGKPDRAGGPATKAR